VVAAHYQREFDRLYTNAIVGLPPAIRKKADRQLRECAQISTTAVEEQPQQFSASNRRLSAQLITSSQPGGANRRSSRSTKARMLSQRVNLNTATQKELEALPGIGAKLALRIIAARQARPLRSLNDLAQVSGVKPKLVRRLEHQVTW
jgi:DNA uptake protein ComE-like DNA-binding protein